MQVDRNTSRNITSSSDLSHTTSGSTDEDSKPIKGEVSGTEAKLQQPPQLAGAKKPRPSRSESRKQKQPQKSEKTTLIEEIVVSDKSLSEGGGEEEGGGLHLGQPVTVFRHMQTLASMHKDLSTGIYNSMYTM